MSGAGGGALDPRVLLVESDEAFAYDLLTAFSHSDDAIEVELVETVRQATLVASANAHDVVVVDLHGASARTSAPALRRLRQATNAPLIVVSNSRARTQATETLSIGADALVVKGTEGIDGIVRAVRVALERKWATDRLHLLAFRDPLTGLHNRASFYARVDDAIAEAGLHGRLAVLFLDLDGFKGINDTYGHWVGDEVLRAIGRRLRRGFDDPSITIGRLGGDEFALLVDPIGRPDDAIAVAERVVELVSQPCVVGDKVVRVGCRCGVAMRPVSGHSTSELVRGADEAMYAAKQGGGSIRVFLRNGTPQWGANLPPATQVREVQESTVGHPTPS